MVWKLKKNPHTINKVYFKSLDYIVESIYN